MNKTLPDLLFFVACLFALEINAQQLPLFTQYREQIGVINPAAMVSGYLLYDQTGSVGASVRQQWVGKDGSPQTQLIQGSYFSKRDRVSPLLGGHIIHDKAGRVSTIGVYGRYGAVISNDPDEAGIAGGIAVGVVQFRVDLNGIIARDADDDLLADQSLQKRIYPDVGLGMYAWKRLGRGEDYIVGGFSIPQVLGLDVTFRNELDKKFNLNRVRHFYALAGWIHHLEADGYLLELNGWFKYVPNAPFHFDANCRYQIAGVFWMGAGYGMSRAFHLEAGLLIPYSRIKVGYGFDFNTSNKILAFGQSHEINISYGFGGDRFGDQY
ncbi:MAG: PorP/SprF family type IX secretion system membrane protein [Phycisphaerae bacterium]|nr:PorP/SprF family type IX secretion system membrane protein [Saprospiraceae bacterium]